MLIRAALTAVVATVASFGAADSTTIKVFLLERPVGQETFTLEEDSTRLALESNLEFVDRGGRVQLASSLRLEGDLTPTHFTAKGKTYRFVDVDLDVDASAGHARVRSLDTDIRTPLPPRFFVAVDTHRLPRRRCWSATGRSTASRGGSRSCRVRRPVTCESSSGAPTRFARPDATGASIAMRSTGWCGGAKPSGSTLTNGLPRSRPGCTSCRSRPSATICRKRCPICRRSPFAIAWPTSPRWRRARHQSPTARSRWWAPVCTTVSRVRRSTTPRS